MKHEHKWQEVSASELAQVGTRLEPLSRQSTFIRYECECGEAEIVEFVERPFKSPSSNKEEE